MKASEAKELSRGSNVEAELKKIYKVIKASALAKRLECWYYDKPSEKATAQLVSDGYFVGDSQWDPRDGVYMTKISW